MQGVQLNPVLLADIAHLPIDNLHMLSVITARNLDPDLFSAARNDLKASAASDLSRSGLV